MNFNKNSYLVILLVLVLSCLVLAPNVMAQEPKKVILDTDLRLPPQDDSYAALMALNSPKIEVLGVSLIFGNTYLAQMEADALRWMEVMGYEDVPVYLGHEKPLVKDMQYEPITGSAEEFRRPSYIHEGLGDLVAEEYYMPEAREPLGGFAEIESQEKDAVQFIIDTIKENPNEVTLVPLGPLTNIAAAMRKAPEIIDLVDEIVIMGGSFDDQPLPGYGPGGIHTAEFNFALDAEAAEIVMTSGAPIVLSPLNVSRLTGFTREFKEELENMGGPVAEIFANRPVPGGEYESSLMFDHVAVAYVINPDLTETREAYVDIDTSEGASYGLSYTRNAPWPGAPDVKPVKIQTDLDTEAFNELFMDLMLQSGTN